MISVLLSFIFLRQVLLRLIILTNLSGPGSSSLASKRVLHRSVDTSDGRTSRATLAVESSSSAAHDEISQGSGVTVSSCLEVIK